MMTAASASWCVAISASAVARSLYGATNTSPSRAGGMPAESCLARARLGDGGMGVAEEHRAGAEEVVEVASAVHVPEVGAAAFLHDELEAGAAPVIAEQATRERVCGASQEVVLIGHDERTSLRPAADCATGLGGTEPRRTHGTPPTERSGLAAPAPTSTGLAAPAPTVRRSYRSE